MPPFTLDNDHELKQRLRHGVTGYEDHPEDLPDTALEAVLQATKASLYNEYGIESFYRDHPTAELLLYATAIKAKARVENYSIVKWSIGDEMISVPDANREDTLQLQEWNKEVNASLSEVPEADDAQAARGDFLTSDFGW